MKAARNWLLLLCALPARKGTSRVSLWRQLKKAGAVALKNSTYVLPDEPHHRERFQWLAQQVRDNGGDATLIYSTHIEGTTDEDTMRMFNAARARFVFASDPKQHPESLPFDLANVEFSHHSDDCTFETLVKRFALDDPMLRQIAEMVHAADIDDGKSRSRAAGPSRKSA